MRYTCKIEQHTTLASHDPGIVAGGHKEEVPRAVLCFRSVVHFDEHAPFQNAPGVRALAGRRARDWFYVLGPTPAGLKLSPADSGIAQGEDVELALAVSESAGLVGLVLGLAN